MDSYEDWLKTAIKKLEESNIETARLDALVLLEDVSGLSRARLLAEPDRRLTAAQQNRLAGWLKRRARHEPLAYIRGFSEFYGRRFTVDNHVLVPRPESETIIELALALKPTKLIDVGTGSGALAITAALELPKATILALDIDPSCLNICRQNIRQLTPDRVTVRKSDLLSAVTDSELGGSTLLCNLPYVPEDFKINLAAGREPRLAIFGGPDGLDYFRTLFHQISDRPAAGRPAAVITESLPPQHAKLAKIAKQAGYRQTQEDDFIQLFTLVA